jgi:hypothetical protein
MNRISLLAALALGAALFASPAAAQFGGPPTRETSWEPGEFDSAWDQYRARYEAAGSDSDEENLPDWSGIWEQASGQGFFFPLRPGETMNGRGMGTETTMKLTPRYAAEHEMRMRQGEAGNDFDPLTYCLPAGFPRWLVEPFMREFYPMPDKTLLINEMMNEIRRVYTDGRGHIPEDLAYPLWEGDSIGFWDDGTLVIHTTSLKANLLQREQPAISERAEVYEEWTLVEDGTIRVRGSLYDPEALLEPHHFIRWYQKVDDMNGDLRLAFWSCAENQPVVRTAAGGSDFGALPGQENTADLTDAETWLMFDEAEEAGLIAEFEAAAADRQ